MGRAPRLLWVNHFAVAPDMGGGTRHIELGRELATLGWDVRIAASDFHLHRRTYLRRRNAEDRQVVAERLDGVEVDWLWASPYTSNDLRRVGNWLTFARSLAAHHFEQPPDLVIGSTPHLFAALAALRVARRLGVPFVLEVRDLWPESLAVGGAARGVGYAALAAIANRLYRRADHIIVLARGVADYLVERGVPRSRLSVVPNGADVAMYAAAGRVNGHPGMRLVYAGAHGPANGLDAVLDAAKELRDDGGIDFLLVGDGPSRQALRARAQHEGLSNVHFEEPVAKSAMPDLLARCDVGLMVLKDVPLFAFGVSPNKIFDYWSAGLPVVCNVAGEVAEWVRESGGGVQAADGSGAALAEAVRQLRALPPDERRRLGERGREWVRREHDRPVLARRLDELLRPLARVEA
ncbi:MAG TPA: glycosyltransferase family 4 protein [Myxococcota bacterium]|nr:glycosyltransferase family 4 protein [Myxococcota bacterium]